MLVARSLGAVYLADGLQASTNLFVEAARTTMDSFETWYSLATSLSILSLVLMFVGVFRPSIRQMDVEMKRTRSMLLLFPEEVIKRLEGVWAGLKQGER